MFPQTEEVESAVLLTKSGEAAGAKLSN